MNCFKPMLVIVLLLMVCTIVQGFNKPYLTVDNNHQIVFVTDVNGAEVKQPFHISGVGLYSEVADQRTIGSNEDIQEAISHIAAARNRMLRLFCCHFSDVPYQDVPFQQLHVPFKRNGATFDVTGFNLSSQYPEKHDTDWRSRLRAAIDKAKDPDGDAATQDAVIIQLSLFDHCDLTFWKGSYITWPYSVWNGNNNNSGNGGVQIIRDSAKGSGMPYFYLTDAEDAFATSDDSWTASEANRLKEIQKNYVRQIVLFTADDWNVMYEIMNEPGLHGRDPLHPENDVQEATPEQVLDWHEDVRSWIIEALMEHGGGQILTPHLISICSPENEYKEILYGSDNFQIVSIHSGALGWDNERKNEVDINNWYPCANPNPPVDYALNIALERHYLQGDDSNAAYPTGKHIIVDTDGMFGFGEPNLHKGWGRDYDEICYHLLNVGLMEGFSFNSKELAHNQLNQNEVDCDRTGDYPWESTFQGMDKPYIDGVNSQISEVFMRPEVCLAGYGYSFLTPGEADGQLFVYKTNPYGNSEITSMSLKLTDIIDNISTETDLSEATGNPNTTFGSYSFSLGTVCETNIFFPNLVISTQANNYERCWPELTIFKSRNTDTLPSSFSGLPPVSETAHEVICDKMNEQNNFQPVVLNQTWDQMIAFKNYIQAHSNQDTAQLSAPCVFAAGFVNSRIIDIYGGKVLFAAIIDHPKGVDIADVKISCDGLHWNSMTPIIEYPNVLYIFDFSLDFGKLPSLSADEFFPVLVKAIDVNSNESDIWPELIVHDVNGNPSDNYRPAVKTPDTTPPVFATDRYPKASGWEFYSDKLKLTWYDAVNTFGFKEKGATYDILVGPSGALILNPVIGDFTGNSYLVEGLDNCTKYDFEVVPKDPCGNVGSKYRGTAYTGNPEIPFGFSYKNGYLKSQES